MRIKLDKPRWIEPGGLVGRPEVGAMKVVVDPPYAWVKYEGSAVSAIPNFELWLCHRCSFTFKVGDEIIIPDDDPVRAYHVKCYEEEGR